MLLKMIVLMALAMLVLVVVAMLAALERFMEFLGSQDDDGEDEV